MPSVKEMKEQRPEEGRRGAAPSLATLAAILHNKDGKQSLPSRFRALFSLRAIDDDAAVEAIGHAFADSSALLKHELAYVLGQMQRPSALPKLEAVLRDTAEDAMVRHECAEAMGAIGEEASIPVLEAFLDDPSAPVRETCEIALDLIRGGRPSPPTRAAAAEEAAFDGAAAGMLTFGSVDPAPAMEGTHLMSVGALKAQLMDTRSDLYHRYKAMFALRNRGADPEAVLALCAAFADESALFRHEVAYVLGQLQHPISVDALALQLAKADEAAMVRHECAEALGSIANERCIELLMRFKDDAEVVVAESCLVALDMAAYEQSAEMDFFPTSEAPACCEA